MSKRARPYPPHTIARFLRCEPRDVRYLLDCYGLRWRDILPDGTHWGVGFGNRCYYWLPPQRASQAFERKLGALDLDIRGEV